jgi:hypothetical protein
VKIIQEVEMNATVPQNELANCSVLSPSLRNKEHNFYGKLHFLKRKADVGHILINEKTFILLNEQGSVPYY